MRRIAAYLWLAGLIPARLVDASSVKGTGPPPSAPATAAPATDDQLEWLVRTYGALLHKVAVAITRSRPLAEEVVQDALLQAWLSMPSWEGDVPIRWLRRVTRNRAISVMRKEQRLIAHDDWEARIAAGPTVETVAESRALVVALDAAMARLDADARTMLVLRETDDMSYEEIANLLDLTPSAVKAKLYRARHSLRQALADWDL